MIFKLRNPFRDLTRFERTLWVTSMFFATVSFIISGGEGIPSFITSLIGFTALIFIAKGYVLGQILSVIFSLLYGFISLHLRYYGETITYLCMSAPMAIMATIAWIRNPYKDTKEVAVSKLTKKKIGIMVLSTALVTAVFGFVLKLLGTASLPVSIVSITTSFAASFLTYCRSPYYALAYAANDIVLIVLWIIAAIGDISYLPMVMCFVMFFANDLYGFFNWRRMQSRQHQ